MRTFATLVVLVLLAAPVRGGDATGAFAPYEDLLEVVADLTWHLRDDAYRFPPPKDPTGHDLYRLSLERLQNWEQRLPVVLHELGAHAEPVGQRIGELDLEPDETAAARVLEHVRLAALDVAAPA